MLFTVFRNVDAPGLEALIKVGDSRSLDDVYCRHILAGRLPELIADTADHPLALSMPITAAVPIGAHMSVPVRLPDGRAYGMFCCLSPRANGSLNQRDLQVMKVFADMAAHQIGRDLEADRAVAEARAEVERVIAGDRFSVLYQPIFDLEPLRVAGFEALCRFAPEPRRSPDAWFKLADGTGCSVRLELAVSRRALDALGALPESVSLAINASPGAIVSGELHALLRGSPMDRLVLELTEHAEVADYGALHSALLPLREAGAKLAVDDAGAGYASFQHILRLSPDTIKLDMSLTRAVDKDAGRRALASALSYFARETRCQIVAEGIETEEELATLKALGVAKGQGYLLGRPMDIQSAKALVDAPVAGMAAV
jgi:EAL domain-containing protein (putative c-di-GMP-specific phosphodiesterase class I)